MFGQSIRAAYITFLITLAAGMCVELGPRGDSPLKVLSRVLVSGDSLSLVAGRAAGASLRTSGIDGDITFLNNGALGNKSRYTPHHDSMHASISYVMARA